MLTLISNDEEDNTPTGQGTKEKKFYKRNQQGESHESNCGYGAFQEVTRLQPRAALSGYFTSPSYFKLRCAVYDGLKPEAGH